MTDLYTAYAEYLERMLTDSDDLISVDLESVPDDMAVSLSWLEWADFT